METVSAAGPTSTVKHEKTRFPITSAFTAHILVDHHDSRDAKDAGLKNNTGKLVQAVDLTELNDFPTINDFDGTDFALDEDDTSEALTSKTTLNRSKLPSRIQEKGLSKSYLMELMGCRPDTNCCGRKDTSLDEV